MPRISRLRSLLSSLYLHSNRTYSTTSWLNEKPFSVIPTCPAPTCACAPTPSLDIDHSRPLTSTIAHYTQHILISTGVNDWPSRIENPTPSDVQTGAWQPFARELKTAFSPKGDAHDPYNPILLNASSFKPNASDTPNLGFKGETALEPSTGSILLFPSFRLYNHVDYSLSNPHTLPDLINAIQSSSHSPTEPQAPASNTRSSTIAFTSIEVPTVLICSHASRDMRCGTMGPILQAEFCSQLANMGLTGNTDQFIATVEDTLAPQQVNVGCVSHVGGHAWAGNVIVYLPPNVSIGGGGGGGGERHALAGMGIWYGRVEPRHVEGIIRETILGGKIIEDLFRGGIQRDGKMISLVS